MSFSSKDIWTYWHQGFDRAPELVQKCAKKWVEMNPTWKVHFLDRSNIGEYVDPLPIREEVRAQMKLAHQSDLVRTQLLIKYGGVWADPTIWPLIPLDEWLLPKMNSGLFFFQKPGRDRIMSNWFMASNPNDDLLKAVFHELCAYWNTYHFNNLGRKEKSRMETFLDRAINRNLEWPMVWFNLLFTNIFKIHPYLIYHYKVYQLMKRNKAFQTKVHEMPELGADGPHSIKRIGLLNPLNKEARDIIDNKTEPLLKLDWRTAQAPIPKGSILEYLFT